MVSACYFSKRILNFYYKFTLCFIQEEGFACSPGELSIGTCEVTEFPVSNLSFHALCTQCALHLDALLALP